MAANVGLLLPAVRHALTWSRNTVEKGRNHPESNRCSKKGSRVDYDSRGQVRR
jgi:hypothetical protein